MRSNKPIDPYIRRLVAKLCMSKHGHPNLQEAVSQQFWQVLPRFRKVSVIRFHSLVQEIHPSACMVSETVLFLKTLILEPSLRTEENFVRETDRD